MVLSTGAIPRTYKEDSRGNQVSSAREAVKKKRDSWKTVGMEPPFRKDVSTEVGECPLLEAVARVRL
jgi:hypothetical protein